jgi:hypothetical protein
MSILIKNINLFINKFIFLKRKRKKKEEKEKEKEN